MFKSETTYKQAELNNKFYDVFDYYEKYFVDTTDRLIRAIKHWITKYTARKIVNTLKIVGDFKPRNANAVIRYTDALLGGNRHA